MTETVPLSSLLRESSRSQHSEAENSTFVVRLMKGELSLEAYTAYLSNLAHLYQALEKQARTGTPFPTSSELWDSRLERLDAITSDLTQLGISDWAASTSPSGNMARYIEHLNSLDGRADFRLVAHHYTRYLGDLSGGQAISALVARHYGASPEQLSFYRFTGINDLVRFKEHYRAQLDGLDLLAEQTKTLVAEVQRAFVFNQSVFEELGSSAALVPTQ